MEEKEREGREERNLEVAKNSDNLAVVIIKFKFFILLLSCIFCIFCIFSCQFTVSVSERWLSRSEFV